MKTIKQYIEWMDKARRQDPDCAHLQRFFGRRSGYRDSKPSNVEIEIYQNGPLGLEELGNSRLFLRASAKGLETLLAGADYEREESGGWDGRRYFSDMWNYEKKVAVEDKAYRHKDDTMRIVTSHSPSKPIIYGRLKSPAEIEALEQNVLESFLRMMMERSRSKKEADLYLNASIFFTTPNTPSIPDYDSINAALNEYGRDYVNAWLSSFNIPHISGSSDDPQRRADVERRRLWYIYTRDRSQPILQAVVDGGIPAVLMPKGWCNPHFNLPGKR